MMGKYIDRCIWNLNRGADGYPTNGRRLIFQSQRRFSRSNRVFFNDFVICPARTYSKNGGIATGGGRIFEPVVLFIRDEIAIPNIGEKHYKKYMSYLLTIFSLYYS
jgi:F-type H+-transporting ATPase subunit a